MIYAVGNDNSDDKGLKRQAHPYTLSVTRQRRQPEGVLSIKAAYRCHRTLPPIVRAWSAGPGAWPRVDGVSPGVDSSGDDDVTIPPTDPALFFL